MSSTAEKTSEDNILSQLISERDSIANNEALIHSSRLLESEIERIKNKDDKKPSPKKYDETDFIDTYSQKMPKVESVLKVPVDIYPQVNFVGRIIGPGGSTLKGIQEVTQTRISVLGKGSQRDKKKAEELVTSGDPKFLHMQFPLHIRISAIGPIDQAHHCVGRACAEIIKLLQVDEEDLAQMNNQPSAGNQQSSFRGGNHRATPRGANNQRGFNGGNRGGRGGARNNQLRGGNRNQGNMRNQSLNSFQNDSYNEFSGNQGYGNSQNQGYGNFDNQYGGDEFNQSFDNQGYGKDNYGNDSYNDGFNNGGGDYNQRMGGRQSGGRMRGNMGSRGNQAGRNRPY